ncbi:hypothetical protein PV350_00355 [Streptomyces sp. PA03-6a]|nr:hypothetical protein [Streptomyces sp. PA03-6a]
MNPELGAQFGNHHSEIFIDVLSGGLPTRPMVGQSAGRAGAVASVGRR